MKKSMLFLPLLMISAALHGEEKGTDVSGAICGLINEMRHEKRHLGLKQESTVSSEMLKRTEIAQLKHCRSFVGEPIAERPILCNLVDRASRVLNESNRRDICFDCAAEIVDTTHPELLKEVGKRFLTGKEEIELGKVHRFLNGKIDEAEFLKS